MIPCRFCDKAIVRDRYCLSLEGERQNEVPSGFWEKFTDHPLENVCGKCYDTINRFMGVFLAHLKENKGKVSA